jgi:hypothetical protein
MVGVVLAVPVVAVAAARVAVGAVPVVAVAAPPPVVAVAAVPPVVAVDEGVVVGSPPHDASNMLAMASEEIVLNHFFFAIYCFPPDVRCFLVKVD